MIADIRFHRIHKRTVKQRGNAQLGRRLERTVFILGEILLRGKQDPRAAYHQKKQQHHREYGKFRLAFLPFFFYFLYFH